MTFLWMLGGALLFAPLTQASPQIHLGGVYDYLDAGQSTYLKQVLNDGTSTAFVKVNILELIYDADGSYREVPLNSRADASAPDGLAASSARLIIPANSIKRRFLVASRLVLRRAAQRSQKPGAELNQVHGVLLDWGRFALQRGASPNAVQAKANSALHGDTIFLIAYHPSSAFPFVCTAHRRLEFPPLRHGGRKMSICRFTGSNNTDESDPSFRTSKPTPDQAHHRRQRGADTAAGALQRE